MLTRKLTLTCAVVVLLTNSLYAQTLFKFGNTEVDKNEFLRVYKKNAINQKPDYSRAALKEYLDLYSLFRMKVKEAEEQHLDTITSIQYELSNYRKQLAQSYLTDEEVSKKQIEEAYSRLQEVVKVSHILIQSSPMAPSKDTVAPYKLIDSLYNVITKGKASFAKMAAQYSDDRTSKVNGGEIGYVTALQTVYPFENAAYSTPVGKVSKPFRTQYGYHILYVEDRKPAQGEVQVAQIMIASPKTKTEEERAEDLKKANQVKAELKKGAKFEDMVKKYSDDNYSKENDGVMEKFGIGAYVPEFEAAAFALKKPGDMSDVIKTDYGYHILKLVKKYPVPPYDSIKLELKNKVERDDRAQIARESFYNSIKKKNNFKEYPENVEQLQEAFVASIADTGADANKFAAKDYKGPETTLFELKGVKYKASDMLTYAEQVTRGRVMGPKAIIFKNIYDNYVKTVVNDIEEENLINEKPEFKNLMTEYRDGIMLFELMDRNVWGKASKDTAGLKEFYEKKKNNYTWQAGFRGSVYNFKTEAAMKEGVKMMSKKGTTDEEIIKKLNTDKAPGSVNIQKGYYEFSKFETFPKADIKAGKPTDAKKNADGTYTVVMAKEVFDGPNPKTLDEARGYVIAEYQDYLEKTWNEQLRKKYPMTVNEKVFDDMVK
ncbi:MAG: peptidylprolyl isomerase [Chitinophagales bacterium]|nr:peptidylprolyl isomerase [Chitinophagales bacterium]